MQKVSIIIPCYNKEAYVKEAVKSALSQTYQNIEIICIDDCSTDNSKTILKALADKYNNIILLEEDANIGVCRARNKAIDIANGEYILPLDADDTLEPSFVEKAINILDKNDDIDVVYSRVRNLNTKKELFKHNKDANLLYGNFITCSAMFKKSDLLNVGGYDTNFDKIGCEDWDLWLTFIEKGLNFYQLNEFLFNYRQDLNKNRTCLQHSNKEEIYSQILFKHKNLYKNNGLFEKIFESLNLRAYNQTLEKKYLKYKKLFNLFLVISLLETVLIITYFVFRNILAK